MDLKHRAYCGALRAQDVGDKVILIMGWVRRVRNHGGVLFMDIRDKTGYIQVVFEGHADAFEADCVPSAVGLESVVAVQGILRLRPKNRASSKTLTGEVELAVRQFSLLSPAKTLPFLVDDTHVSESLLLKYRYLDLRSRRLQHYLQLSHSIKQKIRAELTRNAFTEVDTPILYKSTPEGARDFLVPSRGQPGKVYALAQSPQILKQLLMIGGVDRYFQIAPCFRDEDLRSDRQPEFRQIDLEMSFAGEKEVFTISHALVKVLWKNFKNQEISNIPSLSYEEALGGYGTDKPDLRNPLKLQDLGEVAKKSGFRIFEEGLKKGGVVALSLPVHAYFTRSRLKQLEREVQGQGLPGLLWIKKEEGILKSSAGKSLPSGLLNKCFELAPCPVSDTDTAWMFILAGEKKVLHGAGRFLISTLGPALNLVDKSQDRFVWIREFPLLQKDEAASRWEASHHPFVAPVEEDIPLLLEQNLNTRPLKGEAYDLVCNGEELASGSVRIHQREVQRAMFQALGMTEGEITKKFGFFLEAFQYGVPPHAGIAWGLERLLMLLLGTCHIRDVVAFPKTTSGSCLMSSSPSLPLPGQLQDLGIQMRNTGPEK